MQSDDPPFLSVGTEVSAKFKGAFCEAKIINAQKSIKCKVQFKDPPFGSAVFDDSQIKGDLEANSLVEVHQGKSLVKALVQNAKDCSIYTVVFNDGDERNLRRTQLCLKGAKHFDSAGNLDSLPLYNPEQFGSPVISSSSIDPSTPINTGNVKKRGGARRKAGSSESEGSGEVPDTDCGRVVAVLDGTGRKCSWTPAITVSAKALSTTRTLSTNHIIVRSFKDGKFLFVPNKLITYFDIEKTNMTDVPSGQKQAIDKALAYLQKKILPPQWDYDTIMGNAKEKLQDDVIEERLMKKPIKRVVSATYSDDSSSESDSEYSEERDRFVAQLYKFQDERGTPINKAPILGGRDLDLYRFYKVVQQCGGFKRTCENGLWKAVLIKMKLQGCAGATSVTIKNAYNRYLSHFNSFYRRLGWEMDEIPAVGGSRTSRQLRKSNKDKMKNVTVARKGSVVDRTGSEKEKETGAEQEGNSKCAKAPDKQSECSTICDKAIEKTNAELLIKTEKEDARAPRTSDREKARSLSVEANSSQESPNTKSWRQPYIQCTKWTQFLVGQKVLAQHGQGSSKQWYEARVVQLDTISCPSPSQSSSNKEDSKLLNRRCFLHYLGWNTRYDEWVLPSRIRLPLQQEKKGSPLSDVASSGEEGSRKCGPVRSFSVHERTSKTREWSRKSGVIRKLDAARQEISSQNGSDESSGDDQIQQRGQKSAVSHSKSLRPPCRTASAMSIGRDSVQKGSVSCSRSHSPELSAVSVCNSLVEISVKMENSTTDSDNGKCDSMEREELKGKNESTASKVLTRSMARLSETGTADVESQPRKLSPSVNPQFADEELSSIFGCVQEGCVQTPSKTPTSNLLDEHTETPPTPSVDGGEGKKSWRKTGTGGRRKRHRNYSAMVTEQRRTTAKCCKKEDQAGDLDQACASSPRDSLTALKARIQQRMEADNDWHCSVITFKPIDPELSGDQRINALIDRIQAIKDIHQQTKSDLNLLERRWRRSMEKQRKRDKELRKLEECQFNVQKGQEGVVGASTAQ